MHLADDVKHAKMALSEISAFPFENCLGKIKRMIRGISNPVSQLVRRVSEQKACPEIIKINALYKKKFLIVNSVITCKTKVDIKSIILHGFELNTSSPNNIVKLNSGNVFSIVRIKKKSHNIFFRGFKFKSITNAFKYPCNSANIGIMKLGRLSKRKKVISIDDVLKKCVFFIMAMSFMQLHYYIIHKIILTSI